MKKSLRRKGILLRDMVELLLDFMDAGASLAFVKTNARTLECYVDCAMIIQVVD